ncbi:hypothetical protein Ndes2437B_g01454 [Nannochloris sp. 'desiccata']
MKTLVAFRALFLLVCIFGACRGHYNRRALYQLNGVAFAATGSELLDALGAAEVEIIMLLDDIVFENIPPTPVQIASGRNVTITGPGTPELSGPGPLNTTGAATLDLAGLFPLIQINNDATLILQNLVVKGIPNKYAADFEAVKEKFPRPIGFEFAPSLLADPGSTVILSNVIAHTYYSTTCSEDVLQRVILQLAQIFGGMKYAGYRQDSSTTWVIGWHNMSLSVVQSPSEERIGEMNMVANGLGWQCLDPPWVVPLSEGEAGAAAAGAALVNSEKSSTGGTPSGNDNGLSTGVWVAIGLSIALTVVVTATLTAFLLRRRNGLAAPLVLLPPPVMKYSDEDYIIHSEKAVATTEDPSLPRIKELNQQYEDLAVASVLKIRFGNVEGLEIGHLIGRGAHGRIYKGNIRGTPVAVKVVEHTIEPGNTAVCEHITSEAVLLTALAHPNIVRVFRVATIKLREASSNFDSSDRFSKDSAAGTAGADDIDVEAGSGSGGRTLITEPRGILGLTGPGLYETWLVMEFCEKGSLYGAMKRKKFYTDGLPTYPTILNILIDVAEGMEFLHSGPRAVLHGDLKPANILLKAGSDPGSVTAVVADFGLSRMLDSDDKHSIQRTASLGTVQYMSPELLSAGRLTRAADVWAFGVLMIEIWTGEDAFYGMTAAQVFYSVVQLKQMPMPPVGVSEKYAQLIKECLAYLPDDRIDFERILQKLREIYTKECE